MKEEPDKFYFELKKPQQSTLLALRSIIRALDKNISETQKYGMPCFLYKKNILCYLWTERKTGVPYILMSEGKHLDHPESDIPVQTIRTIFSDAIDLYKKGTVKLK